MPNDFFKFKQFTVFQSRCAMKVGTDGVLLGAWANGGCTVLDIGTGTGLIALMMAQRFPEAEVIGVDIDADACLQATENVNASPFNIIISHKDVALVEGVFDAIVSNPPYFAASLKSPDEKRNLARHDTTLNFHQLVSHAWRLLHDDGEFSVIIPADAKSVLEAEAYLIGFCKSRECAVKTAIKKQPKRYLLAFRKHATNQIETSVEILESTPGNRSEWYSSLTKDFYLR